MSVSDTQKVDLLYKKYFGVAKTDLATNKSPSNEAIASPALSRIDRLWTQALSIPATAAATAGIVQAYTGASAVQCTADATTTPISSVYPSWKTNLTDWIPSEFGSTYFVQVWVDNSGVGNPTATGTQIFDSGSGGTGEWNFDYSSGVLNFIGGTIPAVLTSSKVIYIVGYRYIGLKATNFSNISIGNINISGNTISSTSGNVYINANLTISGNTVNIGSTSLSVVDPIVNIHTPSDLTPLTVNDGADIGIMLHYYDYQDDHAFLGRANDTGFLEWYSRGTDVANVFTGSVYGTIKSGAMLLVNTTPATSTTTGALQVSGGVGVAGNIFAGNILTNNHLFANGVPLTNLTLSNIASYLTTYTGNISAGNIAITGNASVGNLTVMNVEVDQGNISAGNVIGSFYGNIIGSSAIFSNANIGSISINGNIIGNTDITIGSNLSVNGGNIVVTNVKSVALYGNIVGSTANLSSNVTAGNVISTTYYGNIIGTTSKLSGNLTAANISGNVSVDIISPYQTSVTIFNSSTAIGLPVGDSSSYPTANVAGYFRFNSSLASTEFYNGSSWIPFSNSISDQLINPSIQGISRTYTLNQAATAAGIIVSINGTVQQPGVSYTVSGTTITFAENPQITDIIDIRFIASATAVILTGLTEDIVTTGNITGGSISIGNTNLYANTTVISTPVIPVSSANTVIDSFPTTQYRSARYTISSTNPYDSHMAEILLIQNNGIVVITVYGILNTGGNTLTYYANSSAGTANLIAQGSTSSNQLRIQRTYFSI